MICEYITYDIKNWFRLIINQNDDICLSFEFYILLYNLFYKLIGIDLIYRIILTCVKDVYFIKLNKVMKTIL